MHRYPHSPQAVTPPSTDLDHDLGLDCINCCRRELERDRQRDEVVSVFAGQRQVKPEPDNCAPSRRRTTPGASFL